jgi:hypothetical protein
MNGLTVGVNSFLLMLQNMKYPISNPAKLASELKAWAHKRHVKAKVLADFRLNGEVRLAPVGQAQLGDCGCTLFVQAGHLLVACSKACHWIEEGVSQFLESQRVISRGVDVVDCPVVPRRFPRPLSAVRSAPDASARRRVKRAILSVVKSQRFASVLDAVRAAARDAGPDLIVTDRALRSAALSDYNDPDYIYDALKALALAAKSNVSGSGLGMPWTDFLAQNGSHDYSPHSSDVTLQRFRKDYLVVHGGVEYLIAAHVRCGTGSGSESARIYVSQPARPGQPVVVGHVGSHLPIHARSH